MAISRRSFLKYTAGMFIGLAGALGFYIHYRNTSHKKSVLKIGYQPSTHQIAHMTAMEKGWWSQDLKEYGINEVLDYEFPSGPPEMQVMLAGDIDVAYVGATPPIIAIDNGLDAKIVSNVQIQGSHLTVISKRSYSGPNSLKDSKVGTFPPGSIQNTVLTKWLSDNALNSNEDLELISMGPGDAVTSMVAEAIDGCFLPHPYPAIIERGDNGKMVVGSGEMWPNHTCCCLVISGDLLRNNRDLAKEIIRTHIKATEYNIQNKEEAAEIFSRKVGWEVEEVLYSFSKWDGKWVHDPYVGKEITLEYARVLYDLDLIDNRLREDQLFDTSLYDEVS